MRYKYSAFTLIEILVALMIFAIVGVLAAKSLHAMIHTHHILQKKDQQLLQLQITMNRMRRDITQIIDRPIVDAEDSIEAAFVASQENEIVFTRTGVQNSSPMQRIGYVFDKNKLIRLTWNALDQPPHLQPEKQVLLNHVQSVQWQFLTDKNQLVSSWPPKLNSNLQRQNSSSLPKAVEMVMQIQKMGVIQGVFSIEARGVVNGETTFP